MAEHSLQGCHILVVEDEYFLADDLAHALADAGATVIGPFACVEEAATVIAGDARIDAAILDVNLRGNMIFSVADTLAERDIPFTFATGYDQWALPDRFKSTPRVEKPFKVHNIAAVLGRLLVDPEQ